MEFVMEQKQGRLKKLWSYDNQKSNQQEIIPQLNTFSRNRSQKE